MEIRLLDKNLNISSMPIDEYVSIQWECAWDQPGKITIEMDARHYADVRRAKYVYNPDIDDTAVIIGIEYEEETGEKSLRVLGKQLNTLLYGCVIPRTEQISGNLEAEAIRLVQKYAIDDKTQRIDKLETGQAQGYVKGIDTQTTGAELAEILYKILNENGMSWRLHYDYTADKIYFEVLEGKNRTQDQTENTWATVSTSRGNLRNIGISYDDQDYKNYAYVAGSGEGKNRVVVEVDVSHGEQIKSLYVDARNEKKDDEDLTVDAYVGAGNAGKIARYTEDAGWQTIQTGTDSGLKTICYANSKYAFGGTGRAIGISDNGTGWEMHLLPVTAQINSMVYYSGMYVAATSKGMWYSYNGSTWHEGSGPDEAIRDVRRVTRGKNEYIARCLDATMLQSEDGVTWSLITNNSGTTTMNDLCYSRGLYIMCGAGGKILVSKDGTNWETAASSTTQMLYKVAYGAGLYVICGAAGTLITSTDGLTWEQQETGTDQTLKTIAYGLLGFFAVGDGVCIRSDDGISWTSMQAPADIQISAMVFGMDKYKYDLWAKGIEKLEDCRRVDEITGEIDTSIRPTFGVDYALGDICDIIHDATQTARQERITKVTYTYEEGERSIKPEFGTKYFDIREIIAKEAGT